MARPGIGFFLMNFILLFAAIGFIMAVFDLAGTAFVFELGVLLVVMFLLAYSMFAIYNGNGWGWTLLGTMLVLMLIDTFFIVWLANAFETAHVVAVSFTIAGIVVALFNTIRGEAPEREIQTKQDYYDNIGPAEPKEEFQKEPQKEIHVKEQQPVQETQASQPAAVQGDVVKTGIKKEEGYMYFIDKNGDVGRVKMARKGQKTSGKREVVAKVGLKREEGYLYYIDANGDIRRTKMARKKKKPAKKKK